MSGVSKPVTPPKSSAQEIAETSARAMYAEDHASQALGIVVESVGPGRCTVTMTVAATMVNGLGACHGGYIFLLADSALGFASNSHGVHALAQNCAVTYLRPGRLGDRLTAVAKPVARQSRTAIYDVTVVRTGTSGDEVIAEFRGHTRDVEGSWV